MQRSAPAPQPKSIDRHNSSGTGDIGHRLCKVAGAAAEVDGAFPILDAKRAEARPRIRPKGMPPIKGGGMDVAGNILSSIVSATEVHSFHRITVYRS